MLILDFLKVGLNSVTMENSVNLIHVDWNFLWTIVNLVIFYFLLKKFLFKPIMKAMDKRKEMIDKQFKDADDAKNDATELKSQYEDKLSGVNEESVEILEKAKGNAKAEYSRIVSGADKEAKRMLDDARKQIDIERDTTLNSVKSDIASLVVSATEKVVGKETDKDNDSRIYDEFLAEAENDND